MTTESELYAWANREFMKMMGTRMDEALIEYFLTLESEEDIREYLSDLLPDTKYTVVTEFINQLKAKKRKQANRPPAQGSGPTSQQRKAADNPAPPTNTIPMPLIPDAPKRQKKRSPKVHVESPDGPKPYIKPSQDQLVYMPERKHASVMTTSDNHSTQVNEIEDAVVKKKSGHKFVPFTSSEGSKMSTRLPGRHSCQCIGQKHSLINNCTECGRIVCSQEGAGPCLFCGTLVVTPQDHETLRRGGKKATALLDNFNKKFHVHSPDDLLKNKIDLELAPSSFRTALAYKDRLLEYDRTCQQRTKVLDDESDYYRATKWMSPEEAARAELVEAEQHKLKHPSKRGAVTVTLDFAGKQVFEDKKPQLSEQEARDFIEGERDQQLTLPEEHSILLNNDSLAHPNIPFTPKFLLRSDQRHRPHGDVSVEKVSNYRIQDSHLAELSDSGSCLSMHQPWASLLVCGIKRIEGRAWYTTHRGRLWIASTARNPTEDEISSVENIYRVLHGDIEFPDSYPTSTLLGCVNLKDCLLKEDYNSLPLKDENDSPYGFVCEDAHFLKLIVPIKGMHKIWKLDKSTHNLCKRYLSPSNPVF